MEGGDINDLQYRSLCFQQLRVGVGGQGQGRRDRRRWQVEELFSNGHFWESVVGGARVVSMQARGESYFSSIVVCAAAAATAAAGAAGVCFKVAAAAPVTATSSARAPHRASQAPPAECVYVHTGRRPLTQVCLAVTRSWVSREGCGNFFKAEHIDNCPPLVWPAAALPRQRATTAIAQSRGCTLAASTVSPPARALAPGPVGVGGESSVSNSFTILFHHAPLPRPPC